ncbi:MAG: trigger factor [Firmicutes bacterium]|nr:trigger factor [Bacillota bacterium]MBQ1888580.1 trigger factor [Bacillota bacterium]MBQ2456045.1 trigger factor [Bacillota bacterium]MBQ4233786.1 trigger factor [Bacillota bacterium]MBQ6014556.1 trigger factor [Bacillota bacterium]
MTAALVSKENNEAKFTITFTGEEFDAATQKVYLAQRGKIIVDGFRKGKAPRSIIEKRYGEGVFFQDAIDDMINEAYPKALEELDIDPVGYPNVDFGEEELGKGKGFTITVTVPVAPVVVPKDYKGVEAERKIRKITDADIDRELEAEQNKNARLVVAERAAQNGDTVILDYAGFVGEEQFEGGTAENQSLKLGSGQFIPGFEDQLVGVSAGEKKDVCVTFPETYHAENLAGKDAVFHCTVHEVKTEELPELNDDFAKDYSEYETLDEFKDSIRKRLEDSAKSAAEYGAKNAVIDKVYEANPFDVPQVMIDDEAEAMLKEMEQNMAYQGLTMDMYTKVLNKTREDIKNDMKADAEKRVKTRLLVTSIADAENIEASDEELEKEFNDMAAMYGMTTEDLKKQLAGQEKYVKQDIRNRKAIDFIYENAVLTDVEDVPAEAPAEEASEEKNAEETSEN